MTLSELLDDLGISVDDSTCHDSEILDLEIQVHQQQSYPLRGTLERVKVMEVEGKKVLTFAAGEGYNYGNKEAWTYD